MWTRDNTDTNNFTTQQEMTPMTDVDLVSDMPVSGYLRLHPDEHYPLFSTSHILSSIVRVYHSKTSYAAYASGYEWAYFD